LNQENKNSRPHNTNIVGDNHVYNMMNWYLEKLTTFFLKNVLNITFKSINPSTSLENNNNNKKKKTHQNKILK
jgi:hypothetical protein